MNSSRNLNLYKETLSENEQVLSKKRTGRRPPFGMIPATLLARADLTASDKIVLCGLCVDSFKNGYVSQISHAALGLLCGIARTTVLTGLKHLEEAGVIEQVANPGKQVFTYRIVDTFYHAGKLARGTASVPKERPAMVLLKCGRCSKRSKVNIAGFCGKCRKAMEIEQLVRSELRKCGVA